MLEEGELARTGYGEGLGGGRPVDGSARGKKAARSSPPEGVSLHHRCSLASQAQSRVAKGGGCLLVCFHK